MVQQTYLLESKSSDLGNVAVVDPPGSNTSKSENLDSSSLLIPKDT